VRHTLPATEGENQRSALRAAGARHAAAVGADTPQSGVAPAGSDRRTLRRLDPESPYGARRCAGDRRDLSQIAPAACRNGHPHAGPGAGGYAADVLLAPEVLIG